MDESPLERIQRISTGFIEARILLAAARLRLFEQLRNGSRTAAQLAQAVGATLRGIEILMDALAAMGFVVKEDGAYRNDPVYGPLLVEDSPSHLVAGLRHRNRMFRHWAFLDDIVLGRDKPDVLDHRGTLEDAEENENFIRAMYAYSQRGVGAVIDRLDLSGVNAVADLGGGPAHYLAEFGRRLPRADLYDIDLPLSLDVARKIQQGTLEGARIRFVAWDFYAGPPPGGLPAFDLVFVSQIVHAESEEANRALFRALLPLVAPRGRVAVHERLVGPDRTEPKEAALFAVNMLAGTAGGRTWTLDELRSWAEDAGFEFLSVETVPSGSQLVVFRRK